MDAMTKSIVLYLVMVGLVLMATGGLSTFFFCGTAKVMLVQEDEREQRYDPVTGAVEETDSTSIVDESFPEWSPEDSECEKTDTAMRAFPWDGRISPEEAEEIREAQVIDSISRNYQ